MDSIAAHLTGLITGFSADPILVGALIVVLTAFFEDPTTVVIGVLTADKVLPLSTALIALYIGIVLGDFFLFGVGWFARTHPKLARYVDHERVAPFRLWLETRYALTIFSVRFIPGLRLPTYLASGFFRASPFTFLATAIGATFVWTMVLFSAFYWYGSLTSEWIGWVRYGIAALFLIVLFFLGRHNLRAYRVSKDTLS